MMNNKEALELHRKLRGKFSIKPKVKLTDKLLSLAYTPGVAAVSREIFRRRKLVYDYTIKGNSVAVVSDGSSVLGLGNIGAEAALPVMEGKAILFKEFADIDAFPICLKTQDTDEIIKIVKNIAPVFGGINLEDIESPKCFVIEERLQDIGIPVMHDDQHGTAVVVFAGLLNACKVLKKDFEEIRVIINGAGAAGSAIAKLLVCDGYRGALCNSVKDVIVIDSKGAIYRGRKNLEDYKRKLAGITNKQNVKGGLQECINGADVFIGVSRGSVLKENMVRNMNTEPIVFALANPTPEIMPDKAKNAGAKIIATGRNDFPNQVNNALVFPGIFRGALNIRAQKITAMMKLRAAHALASTIVKPEKNKILPSIFDKRVVKNITQAVERCA